MTNKSVTLWLTLVVYCIFQPAWAEEAADVVWIDVRTPAEYASGHVPQAILIPFDGIEAGVAQRQLSKDTPIYLYCAAGGRAEKAKERLEALGYTEVTNVGGLKDAEKLAGAAVVQ
ncbi:MAG: rhodanese-like domain-containing protein [Halioglobus sp.]|nr:rhodanese-like domain-containing protein [Halioglobus sp.]